MVRVQWHLWIKFVHFKEVDGDASGTCVVTDIVITTAREVIKSFQSALFQLAHDLHHKTSDSTYGEAFSILAYHAFVAKTSESLISCKSSMHGAYLSV